MIASSQIGQSTKVCGPSVKCRASRRAARRSCVAQCSKKANEESVIVNAGKVAINAAVAAALLSASGPALADFKESQAQESLFEKIIRERGGKLPELTLPKSAPALKAEAKEEAEVYVPPKQVELVDIPLKLSEPVRSTTQAPPARVPEPEPAKKASVSQEGIVKIVGGDIPAPPPAKPREAPKEAPKLPFSFAAPKAEEAPKPVEALKAAAPTLPVPPPAPAAKVEEAPTAAPAPVAEPPKPFGGFFQAPGEESKPDPAESKGQAGKPELPQQEPAVTPGTTITIPESKNIAPEPKVEAPQPATKAPAAAPVADDNPFAIFSQSAATPAQPKAPAPEPAKPEQQDTADSGSGLPVWVAVGGSVAVAVAAFLANGKNQTEVRAAEQQAEEPVKSTAEAAAEAVKDLEPTSAKGSKEE